MRSASDTLPQGWFLFERSESNSLDRRGRPFHKPQGVVRGIPVASQTLLGHRLQRAFVPPFMDLTVAVGKTNPARTGVITRRQISPATSPWPAVRLPSVVDAVRMFVYKNPQIRRGRPPDIRKLLVGIARGSLPRAIVRVGNPDKGIHGNAADPREG